MLFKLILLGFVFTGRYYMAVEVRSEIGIRKAGAQNPPSFRGPAPAHLPILPGVSGARCAHTQPHTCVRDMCANPHVCMHVWCAHVCSYVLMCDHTCGVHT